MVNFFPSGMKSPHAEPDHSAGRGTLPCAGIGACKAYSGTVSALSSLPRRRAEAVRSIDPAMGKGGYSLYPSRQATPAG